jgi:hypothetical protein
VIGFRIVACLSTIALAVHLYSQGMATGNATAQPSRPLPPGLQPPRVSFVDVAKQAGLTDVNVSGAQSKNRYIVETTGNGVVLFDFNNDGLLDIFLPNADRFESEGVPARHYLYQNLGKLRFEDVTVKSGIKHTGWAQGGCAGDVDNDGHIDLFITHWGANVLYRNKGNGTFDDQTRDRGLYAGKERWSTGCAFLDYDRDGALDLFVANYVQFDPKKVPLPGQSSDCQWKGMPVMCGPRGLPGESMSLFHNDGKGFFTDVSAKSGIAGERIYYGFTALTGDFDDDGWTDVYVACDSTASLLFRNKRDGTFEEIGLFSGAAYNEDGREQAGMGATAGDYDRDGSLDIFKTNFSDDTPTLYKNDGRGAFSDVTVSAGLAVHTKFLGWGTAFLDVDHDGWKDIFVANGHVYPEVEAAGIGENYRQQRLLFWNRRDKQFHDISAQAGPAIRDAQSSRGIAAGDLDNDGKLEIVIVNMRTAPSLLKNTAPQGNWLLLRLLTKTGRDAFGARVTVTTPDGPQVDEIRSGGFHISQGDPRVHFGLGRLTTAAISVRWPDGTTETFESAAANTIHTIRQGTGKRAVPSPK